MGRAAVGSKARSAHILDVARKSHGARLQNVKVERFPGGAAVRGEGVGVVSDYNLLTSPRQHLKRPPSSSGGAFLVGGLERRAGRRHWGTLT